MISIVLRQKLTPPYSLLNVQELGIRFEASFQGFID